MADALFLFWSSHQYIDYTSIRHVIHSFSLQSTHTSLTFRMMCLVVLCTQKVTIIDGSLTPPSSLSPSSCIHLLTYSVQLNYVCITKAIYLAWANEHWQYAFIIIIHWPHRTTHAQILMVYIVFWVSSFCIHVHSTKTKMHENRIHKFGGRGDHCWWYGFENRMKQYINLRSNC